METPVNVSEMLANLPGGKSDDEPDWLKELEDDEVSKEASGRQGSQSSDDPFAFLTTPSKSPRVLRPATPVLKAPWQSCQPPFTSEAKSGAVKGTQQQSTPGVSSRPEVQEASTPQLTPKKTKAAGRAAGVQAPGRVTIKNPDRVVFNRLLVELPYKESDCVDLSGDTGAVGRFIFTDRIKANQPEDPPSAGEADASEPPATAGDGAGPSSAPQAENGEEGNDEPDATEEVLVLDLKGVKFDAQIATLAGTACVVNIGPSGAKVEAVFNEFVQLEETSVFEDYEEVTDGTLQGWTTAEPEDGIAGDNTKSGPSKKPKKSPLISSGRVAKATKRKGASKTGKSRTSQKTAKKNR